MLEQTENQPESLNSGSWAEMSIASSSMQRFSCSRRFFSLSFLFRFESSSLLFAVLQLVSPLLVSDIGWVGGCSLHTQPRPSPTRSHFLLATPPVPPRILVHALLSTTPLSAHGLFTARVTRAEVVRATLAAANKQNYNFLLFRLGACAAVGHISVLRSGRRGQPGPTQGRLHLG